MTGPHLTITGARPSSASGVSITSAQPAKAPRSVGLGADLSRKPAMPVRRSRLPLLFALGGIAFALGVGATLSMHRPDLLPFQSAFAGQDVPAVTRSDTALISAPAEQEPLAGTIALTPEQQDDIARVLALGSPTAEPVQAPAPAKAKFHVIAPGDTLASIAAKYYGTGDRAEAILAANTDTIRNPDTLMIGRILTIPPL